jgi:hypothetical protein
VDFSSPGSALVTDSLAGSMMLWDEGRRESEFFLVERRSPSSPTRQYDDAVGGDGVCIWRVTHAADVWGSRRREFKSRQPDQRSGLSGWVCPSMTRPDS